ncbi:hypothetical protein [Aquimarina litoralis]|uniref:hypothetical protein n=1 Tax=Aquimarina litoralis TaxID=584605 RepID=UPI001C55CEBC|nr:hypothetical protein [Aquimarina litoralis]MBW1294977.1 hypothetical protein [Aquimarina litoralis]
MKIGKYLSMISILIALVFVVLKIQFDVSTFHIMKEIMSKGDSSPKLIAGGIKIVLLYVIPVLISLLLSIIGMKRKNAYRKIALTVNILTIIYLIIPVGLIMSTF